MNKNTTTTNEEERNSKRKKIEWIVYISFENDIESSKCMSLN